MPKRPSPAAGAPGAPDANSTGLLVGVYATATLPSGMVALHLFDWEVRIRQSSVEVTAHGDEWEVHVPLRQGWTARARGYMTRSAPGADTYTGYAKRGASPAVLTFTGYSNLDTAGTSTSVIFKGTCLWEDITIQVPNAMVEQEVTLRGNTAPSDGVPA